MSLRSTPKCFSSALVLRYRSLADGRRCSAPASSAANLPVRVFRRQLDEIQRQGGSSLSVRDWLSGANGSAVLLTFDDGNASDRRVAVPMLLDRAMRADFFIHPADVGSAGHTSWAELREMSAAGLSIQSHGYDRQPFARMSAGYLRESLRAARMEIEVRIGCPVSLLGSDGPLPRGFADIARECGYSHVLGTRPGWSLRDGSVQVLPRATVGPDVGEGEFRAWIERRPLSMLRRSARYRAIAVAQDVIGESRLNRAIQRAQSLRGSLS